MTDHASPQEERFRGAQDAVPALDELLSRLSDADPTVRAQAAIDLRRLRDPRAVPALLVALDDSESPVWYEASVTLDQMPLPTDIPFLFELAARPNPHKEPVISPEREARFAYEALNHIWLPAITYLAKALVDPDPAVRRGVAANLCAHLRFLQPTPATSATPEKDLRLMVEMLQPAVLHALHDGEVAIRLEAVEALRENDKIFDVDVVITVLLLRLHDEDSRVRGNTARLLRWRYQPPLEALRPYLQDNLPGVRAAAVEALPPQLDDGSRDALLTACADAAPEVRLAALTRVAEQLEETTDKPAALPNDVRVMTAFEQFAEDDDAEIRRTVAKHLRVYWHQLVTRQYLSLLISADSADREKAIGVLSELDDYTLGEKLAALYATADSDARLAILQLALRMQTFSYQSQKREPNDRMRDWAIKQALCEHDMRMRIMAIDDIIQQQAVKYYQNLLAAMEDNNAEVAARAKEGVRLFQGLLSFTALAEMLQADQVETRREAVKRLFYSPDPKRNELLHRAFRDTDDIVRRYAISIAREWGVREFIPDLIELMRQEDSRANTNTAIQALGESGDQSTIPFLISLLRSTGITRIDAHIGLEMLTGLPGSKDLLFWEDWWAKQQAGKG